MRATLTLSARLVAIFLPFSVRDGPHASDSVRIAGHIQFQPHPRFAGRLDVFGRIDASGRDRSVHYRVRFLS